MKYYSDLTKKIYNTEDELNEAELKVSEEEKKKELAKKERGDAAKRVEDAFKQAADARKDAEKELQDFCAKYGTYRANVTDATLFSDPLEYIFSKFFF